VIDEKVAIPEERAPQQYVAWGHNADLKLLRESDLRLSTPAPTPIPTSTHLGTAVKRSAGSGRGEVAQERDMEVDVDAEVKALLREWKLEDQVRVLAKNGVISLQDLEYMTTEDVKEMGLRLSFRGLLLHLSSERNKRHSYTQQKIGLD
jgi:hypothetical protein